MSVFEQLVWLIPLVCGVTALWRPSLGLFVLAGSLALFGSPPGGPYLAALDVAGLLVISGVVLRRDRWTGDSKPGPLAWPAAALVLTALASLLPLTYHPPAWSPSVIAGLLHAIPGAESWTALYTWRAAEILIIGYLLFWSARRVLDHSSVRRLGMSLAIGVGVVCTLGLLEQLHLLNLDAYRAIGSLVPRIRMHSLFFNSGWFAEYLVVATPFATASLIAGRRYRLALLVSVLALLCVVLSEQRGAWFAVMAVMGCVGWLERDLLRASDRFRHLAFTAGLCAVAGLGLVLGARPDVRAALGDRVENVASDLAGRTPLWVSAVRLTAQRPVLGWGLGSFAPAYDKLNPPGSAAAQRPRSTAHNWILNVAAERGLLGVVALLVLAGATGSMLTRAATSARGPPRTLAVGLIASLVGAAVYGTVQYVPYLESLHWLLWILLAAAVCVADVRQPVVFRRLAVWVCVSLVIMVPLRVAWRSSPDWRGDRAYGFHETERSGGEDFQWAGPEAALRIPWRGDCLVLTVANGHPSPHTFPVRVDISAAGVQRSIRASADWQDVVLPVGQPQESALVLRLSSDNSFRPFLVGTNAAAVAETDIRKLSVAVRKPTWRPCPASDR